MNLVFDSRLPAAHPSQRRPICAGFFTLRRLTLLVSLVVIAFSGSAQETPPLLLPSFVVSGSQTDAPRWRYLKGAGFELLTNCDEGLNRKLIPRLRAFFNAMQAVFPEEVRRAAGTPTLFILDAREREIWRGGQRVVMTPTDRTLYRSVRRYGDGDLVLCYVNLFQPPSADLSPSLFDRQLDQVAVEIVFGNALVEQMGHTAPYPPGWFIPAVSGVFRLLTVNDGELRIAGVNSAAQTSFGRDPPLAPLDQMFARMPTLSAAWMRRNDDDFRYRNGLPKVTDGDHTIAYTGFLFLHWALFSDQGKRAAALWRFIHDSAARGTTEDVFIKSFNLSYREALVQIGNYAKKAMGVLTVNFPPGPVDALTRAASAAEISRITGTWCRLAATETAEHRPQLISAAEKLLLGPIDEQQEDENLLAERGILLSELGRTDAALVALEKAAAKKVSRPRAYAELAQLRLRSALADPKGRGGKLSLLQINRILEPIGETYRLSKQVESMYVTLIRTWESAEISPPVRSLKIVSEGAHLFPANNDILIPAIRLLSENGLTTEAEDLRGLVIEARP
jgi:hypothetical protein